MQEWWHQTQKDVRVLWSVTLKEMGITKNDDDEEFRERNKKIQTICKEVNAIQSGLKLLAQQALASVSAAEDLDAILKNPNDEPSSKREICQKWLEGEMNRRCLAPLDELSKRAVAILEIRRKRRRKKSLMQTSSGEEQEKWRTSYNKYNDAFLNGVDQLVAVYESVIPQVINAQKWILQELTKELTQAADDHVTKTPNNEAAETGAPAGSDEV